MKSFKTLILAAVILSPMVASAAQDNNLFGTAATTLSACPRQFDCDGRSHGAPHLPPPRH